MDRAERALSDEPALTGRGFVGEASLEDSCPKKMYFLVPFGVEGPGLTAAAFAGKSNVRGVEFRRTGLVLLPESPVNAVLLPRTAPAVLGRESLDLMLGAGPVRRYCSWAKEPDADNTDEILPETECPGRIVIVLEVSLETSDNGRGINSTVSENPTRLRIIGAGFGKLEGPAFAPSLETIAGSDEDEVRLPIFEKVNC